MCEALSPYPWRSFTPELLARLALAARDRHLLDKALSSVQGAAVGRWGVLEPVARDDARLASIVEFLGALTAEPDACAGAIIVRGS